MAIERFGPTRRGGPVFRWLGEPLAIDLANTVMVVREGEAIDLLAQPQDMRQWLDAERERLGDYRSDPLHLERIQELRQAIRSLLNAAAGDNVLPLEAVEYVNAASAAAPVAPQIDTNASSAEPRATEAAVDHGSLEWLLGTFARSAIALLTGPERKQLKVCRAPSCGMFFLGARRWCCSACGNRARAARHYRRTRESQRT